MANPEHVRLVREGREAIARWWRRKDPREKLDLTGAALPGVDLRGADLGLGDLSTANLLGANLLGANLLGANLYGASLSGANLSEAILFMANLRGTKLSGVDLTSSDLTGATFWHVNFSGANLSNARCGMTTFANCDLSQCRGLESVVHESPSSIGIDTIIRSEGNIPRAFLLGAGVPNELLAALSAILAKVPYRSCFIAYGEPDRAFAERLVKDLRTKGISAWIYSMNATPGEPTWREIGQKRREADKMVVLCSAQALVRDGVLKEIEEQIDEEPDKMVPVSLDNLWKTEGFRVMRVVGKDLKPFLLSKNYADFSDASSYEKSLERLLKALERERS